MGAGAQMVAEAGQSQGGSAGRCERAQEGTGGAMGGGDALAHPTPHTLPTGRTTGHAGRHRVRSIHPPHTMPTEGAQMAHRARSVARGTVTHPPRQDEPQPHRMSRRRCAAYLYGYGSTAHPQSREPARRKG